MASATYDGTMRLGCSERYRNRGIKDHTKRVWSTEFSPIDPTRLLSASDDSTTRVWSITQKRECMVINDPNQANICSVNSSRMDSNLIAVGSADHKVHVYDLRNAVKPTLTLETHKKAVSYVTWMGNRFGIYRLFSAMGWERTARFVCVHRTAERKILSVSTSRKMVESRGSEDNTVRNVRKICTVTVAGHSFMRGSGCGLREEVQPVGAAYQPVLRTTRACSSRASHGLQMVSDC